MFSASAQVPPIRRLSLSRQHVLRCPGKVPALAWSPSGTSLLTAPQGEYLLEWDATTGQKKQAVAAPVYYLTSCTYSPSGRLIACGGLDNACSVYDLTKAESAVHVPLRSVLLGHDGFISACQFMQEETIVTSSGDGTAMEWDAVTERATQRYAEHPVDMLDLALPRAGAMLVTASLDGMVCVWDRRTARIAQRLAAHTRGVNSVVMFPDDQGVVSGSDDGTCRLWDLRAAATLAVYPTGAAPVQSVSLSPSGRLLYAGTYDARCVVYDVLRGDLVHKMHGHHGALECVRSSPSGTCVATAARDGKVILWGP